MTKFSLQSLSVRRLRPCPSNQVRATKRERRTVAVATVRLSLVEGLFVRSLFRIFLMSHNSPPHIKSYPLCSESYAIKVKTNNVHHYSRRRWYICLGELPTQEDTTIKWQRNTVLIGMRPCERCSIGWDGKWEIGEENKTKVEARKGLLFSQKRGERATMKSDLATLETTQSVHVEEEKENQAGRGIQSCS